METRFHQWNHSFVLYLFPHHYIHSAKYLRFFLYRPSISTSRLFLHNANKARIFVTIPRERKNSVCILPKHSRSNERRENGTQPFLFHLRKERRIFFRSLRALLPHRPSVPKRNFVFCRSENTVQPDDADDIHWTTHPHKHKRTIFDRKVLF